MTVLPDHQIKHLGREGMITPYADGLVQPASYDCLLGDQFVTFGGANIDMSDVRDDTRKLNEKQLLLHPGDFVLGVTAETFNIPDNIVARIEGKSSIGRMGLMVHVTAGFIDPGFRGPVTLEIVNLRPRGSIMLRAGLPVCQVSFHRMASVPDNPYTGRYQDAQGVEASLYGRTRDVKASRHHRVAEGGARFPCTCTVGHSHPVGEERF